MAELYGKDVRTINEHLINIYQEGEIVQHATIRKFRIVRLEGARQIAREIERYYLDASKKFASHLAASLLVSDRSSI